MVTSFAMIRISLWGYHIHHHELNPHLSYHNSSKVTLMNVTPISPNISYVLKFSYCRLPSWCLPVNHDTIEGHDRNFGTSGAVKFGQKYIWLWSAGGSDVQKLLSEISPGNYEFIITISLVHWWNPMQVLISLLPMIVVVTLSTPWPYS